MESPVVCWKLMHEAIHQTPPFTLEMKKLVFYFFKKNTEKPEHQEVQAHCLGLGFDGHGSSQGRSMLLVLDKGSQQFIDIATEPWLLRKIQAINISPGLHPLWKDPLRCRMPSKNQVADNPRSVNSAALRWAFFSFWV